MSQPATPSSGHAPPTSDYLPTNAKKNGNRISIQTWVLQINIPGTVLTDPWALGLVRFIPRSDSTKILIGQPQDDNIDVGVALRKGQDVSVDVYSGSSVLSAGQPTGTSAIIDRILSPVSQIEAGTIRCIGLNVGKFCRSEMHSLTSCVSTSNMPQK